MSSTDVSPSSLSVEISKESVKDLDSGKTYNPSEVIVQINDYGDKYFDVEYMTFKHSTDGDLVGSGAYCGMSEQRALEIASILSDGVLEIKRVRSVPANGVYFL